MISLCFIWLIFGVFHSNIFLVTSKPSKNELSPFIEIQIETKKIRARMKPEPKLEFEMVAKDSCRLWCWLIELLKGFEHGLVGPCYRLQARSFTQVCAYQVWFASGITARIPLTFIEMHLLKRHSAWLCWKVGKKEVKKLSNLQDSNPRLLLKQAGALSAVLQLLPSPEPLGCSH